MFGIPLTIILGVLSGFGVNAAGALAGGGAKAIVLRTVLPLAVQLAQSVIGGSASRTTAEDLLKAAGHSIPTAEDHVDGKTNSSTTATKPAKKR